MRPTTTEEVPTFYHLTEYKDSVCNGTAFTDVRSLGCNGWHGLSLHECKMKCAGAEALDLARGCPEKLCFAGAYYQGGGGWCHLFDHANCLGMTPQAQASMISFKKEHGGKPGGGLRDPRLNMSNINLGAIALAAGAALVAASEMSHRHRASVTTSLKAAAVWSGAYVETDTTYEPYSPRQYVVSGNRFAHTTASPAYRVAAVAGPQGDGASSSFSGLPPLAVLFLLLVLCICCCSVGQALYKRKQQRDEEDEYEGRIPVIDLDLE